MSAHRPFPRSCDTFVALSPATAPGCIIFGKNSDRPDAEAQHVVAFPRATHPPGAVLRCSYVSIPQVSATLAVILSKPSWMWGAESAANEAGLAIGNEAVWTREPDGPEALLGMDMVRLAAERCSTAAAAVDEIARLIERHGQGGGCEERGDWSYHNSFLIADRAEAWVVETAGQWWAAEKVVVGESDELSSSTGGVRNISNCLSIRTKIDRCSAGLREHAQRQRYWDGEGEFDWARAFSSGHVPLVGVKSEGREAAGEALMQEKAAKKEGNRPFGAADMMAVLRDKESGICMAGGGFRSNGSQVSVLRADGNDLHWFTGTPDPSKSCFKPFAFQSKAEDGNEGVLAVEPAKTEAAALWTAADRAQREVGGRQWGTVVGPSLRELEEEGMALHLVGATGDGAATVSYSDFTRREMQLYSSILGDE